MMHVSFRTTGYVLLQLFENSTKVELILNNEHILNSTWVTPGTQRGVCDELPATLYRDILELLQPLEACFALRRVLN